MGIKQTIGPNFNAGAISYTPTTPETSQTVQEALDARPVVSNVAAFTTTVSSWTSSNGRYYSDVTHSLGTLDITPQAYLISSGTSIDKYIGDADFTRLDINTLRVWSPVNADVRVIVMKAPNVSPSSVTERLVPVANQTARYALTTATVSLGYTVKQIDTGVLYLVIDLDNLDNASGYLEYVAGTAAAVAWSGVTSKPTTLSGYGITDAAPSSHVGATGAAHGVASSSVNGFMSTAHFDKLEAIEASADVTDTANVGSSIAAASTKTTPVDGDSVAIIDSAASNVVKRTLWSQIKATLKTYFDTIYTLANLGGVPTTRTVNSKALLTDISLTYTDVGASSSSHTHNYAASETPGGAASKIRTSRPSSPSNGDIWIE